MNRVFSAGVWGALVVGLVAGLFAPGVAVAQEELLAIKVERRVFPVTLSDGNTYEVVGYLYYQGSLENRPVQVLTHGITYTHAYWDMPRINGESYSYAEYMARRHYAVLALDMLGTGESSRPDGDFLTLQETVDSLHQVVQQLRATAVKNTFEQIVYVGHSNGALLSTFAQALFQDADALVLTGWMNSFRTLPVGPEVILPLLANPYVVLPPEMRAALFYDAANSDPDVPAYDNAAISDTVSRGQLLGMLGTINDPSLIPTSLLTGPVLVQLADHDPVAPAALAAQEAGFYPNANVQVQTLSNLGHVYNGHFTRHQSWEQIDAWIRASVPHLEGSFKKLKKRK